MRRSYKNQLWWMTKNNNMITTQNGFTLTRNDIAALLKDWGTNIQVGEQYSTLTMAGFILDILNNAKTNYDENSLMALNSRLNSDQKAVFKRIAEALKLSNDNN